MIEAPKTARGRETRERMIRAAADLIHLHGVHGTSLDDILAASGTGKSQFYRYFENKEHLVSMVLQHQMRWWIERTSRFLTRLDTWEAFEQWFDQMVAFQTARKFAGGCPVGSLAAEMADSDTTLRLELSEAFRVRRNYIAEGLAKMKQRGELVESADPEALSEFALAAIQGGLLLASTEKNGDLLRHTLDNALAHLRSFARAPDNSRK